MPWAGAGEAPSAPWCSRKRSPCGRAGRLSLGSGNALAWGRGTDPLPPPGRPLPSQPAQGTPARLEPEQDVAGQGASHAGQAGRLGALRGDGGGCWGVSRAGQSRTEALLSAAPPAELGARRELPAPGSLELPGGAEPAWSRLSLQKLGIARPPHVPAGQFQNSAVGFSVLVPQILVSE